MSDTPRLLIALPTYVFDQFIGDEAADGLRDLFDVHRIEAAGPKTEGWAACFREQRPVAVLTGWGTPALPADAVPDLKMVAHSAGAVRGLVSRDMIEQGLKVTNWGGLAAANVAEHALTLTLATLRRLPRWTQLLHNDAGWQDDNPDSGVSLFGKRVGIHGLGAVARHLIKLLTPFGCRIQVYSEGVPAEVFDHCGVARAESLAAMFADSDVVVEAEALTDASRGSVTAAVLGRLPHGAAFINVGRGATVDQHALAALAREGQIHVGLDVFDSEPLATSSPLRGLRNVLLTPHVAGPTLDQRRVCGRQAVDNLKRFATGKPLVDVVTVDVYDRST